MMQTTQVVGKVHSLTDGCSPELESPTMVEGYYWSQKGFVIHPDKIEKFCLLPGGKHANEFFLSGYSIHDGARLFRDMEAAYDISKRENVQDTRDGYQKCCIAMELGSTAKHRFCTVWRNDGIDGTYRFISAYIDRRLEAG